jgi:hypothetical protein
MKGKHMKKHLRLNTFRPVMEDILEIGEISSRLASDFCNPILDELSMSGRDSFRIWVNICFEDGIYYVEHAVHVSDEEQEINPYDNKEVGLMLRHAYLSERNLASAIAGSILLSFDRTFGLTIFGLPEEETWAIRAAVQEEVSNHNYGGDGDLVAHDLLDRVMNHFPREQPAA